MPAGRFLLPDTPLVAGDQLVLPEDAAHQVRDVLRLSTGDEIHLLDGSGYEYSATVVTCERKRVEVRVGPSSRGQAEPQARIVLCQGVLKAAKYEWVLQKGTELGVAEFVPLLTERAVGAMEETSEAKRRRWSRIVAEAIEQCGGTRMPVLAAPKPLMHALAALPRDAIALIPWEEADATPLVPALRRAVSERAVRGVYLFVGPEGGFSAREIALAQRHGALPVTLGPRILRAETAAIVAATLALAALGELDAAPRH